MTVKWTEEQQNVIDTRDCNLLVSAAAGSGKTAVLVARILALIMDEKNPADIDRLLVVTFTNAAAAEMRERIRDALEEQSARRPDNIHLQRQLVLVHNAKITTIHSFCLHVVRNHFQSAGVDPGFRVADPGEVTLLEQDAAKEAVDGAYEAGTPEFTEFLERFTTGKSDYGLEETVLQIYHFALGQPWPDRWLDACRRMYEAWDAPENEIWQRFVAEDTARMLADMREQLAQALEITREPDGPYPYEEALRSDLELIGYLAGEPAAEYDRSEWGPDQEEDSLPRRDYASYAEAFQNMPPFARLGAKKDDGISEQKKQQVKGIRDSVKNAVADLRKRYYYDTPETIREEFEESGIIVRALASLTEDFMARLEEKKAQQNILDFGDLEHLALKTLVDVEKEKICPSAVAREYAESFREIMIDEYQDSNLVQELILDSVSGRGQGEKNRFMVGDVKQSIYRFRLARPELFMEKYRTYQTAPRRVPFGSLPAGPRDYKIDLHRNFRSRREVLEGINYIFRQIMTKPLGGIAYDEDAALYPAADFPPRPGETHTSALEFHLLEASGPERQRQEARLAGGRIREIVGQESVWDKELGQYRPAQYSDIVILLRTVSGWAETFGEVLGEMGIPCFTGSQTGYFSAAEIRVVLSYLRILDNPRQDIPLAAVLRSPIGGMTDDELARIRSASGNRLFYDCCRSYCQSGTDLLLKEKLGRFFAVYGQLRESCAHTPVHELLWNLLEITGYGAYARALPGGAQRKANLDMLVEKAIAYESTSYRGLYHFVRYIDNLKKYEVDYGEANTGAEAADTVRIMSIHKSKGLEFPIVLLCGLGKQFNESDIRSRVVMHPDFGIGCDCVDIRLRTRQPSLLKKTIRQQTAAENLGEELRVLYVAMTRAKEKLILTGTADIRAKAEKWIGAARHRKEPLPYSWLSGAGSYLDWVVPALLRHPDSAALLEALGADPADIIRTAADLPAFSICLADMEETAERELQEESGRAIRMQELLNLETETTYDAQARDYLEKAFASTYAHEKDREIIGKLSVSELKKMSRVPEETDARELYQPETVIPLTPAFRGKEETLTGTARGTAYHLFMENLDYSRKEDLEIQLEELIRCGKMSPEEGKAIRLEDIRVFLKTGSGRRMERAALGGKLYREQPFVFGVPASEIRAGWNPAETVLVQGIIDAYFLEDEELVLLDYKTDRVFRPQELVDKYRAQLDYYAKALERLTCRKVRDRIIYSFHLGRDIIL